MALTLSQIPATQTLLPLTKISKNLGNFQASNHLSAARFQLAGLKLRSTQYVISNRDNSELSRRFEIRASDSPAESSGAKVDESKFGLGGKGTFFGFGPKQEREVGRLAMIGFVAGIVMEVLTGRGVLAQLNIDPLAVRFPFLAGLAFLFVGGLVGGYTVINNPPDIEKAPANAGAGLPRDPLKTFDAKTLDPLTTYTRGGVIDKPDGQKAREPYASDLDLPEGE